MKREINLRKMEKNPRFDFKEKSFAEFRIIPGDDLLVNATDYRISIQSKKLIKVIVLEYE